MQLTHNQWAGDVLHCPSVDAGHRVAVGGSGFSPLATREDEQICGFRSCWARSHERWSYDHDGSNTAPARPRAASRIPPQQRLRARAQLRCPPGQLRHAPSCAPTQFTTKLQ